MATELQQKIYDHLSNGPLQAGDLYLLLYPGRKPLNSAKGGPSGAQAAIDRMMGRVGFRDLFERELTSLETERGYGDGSGQGRYRIRAGVTERTLMGWDKP